MKASSVEWLAARLQNRMDDLAPRGGVAEFARMAALSRETMEKALNGDRKLRLSTVDAIAEFLDMEPYELFMPISLAEYEGCARCCWHGGSANECLRDNLKQLCRMHNWTAWQADDVAGVSKGTIHAIAGGRGTRVVTVFQAAEGFEIEAWRLMAPKLGKPDAVTWRQSAVRTNLSTKGRDK